MTKILYKEIEYCNECPYHAVYNIENSPYICGAKGNFKIEVIYDNLGNHGNVIPPANCPLEDK